jgi:hypothetical protein
VRKLRTLKRLSADDMWPPSKEAPGEALLHWRQASSAVIASTGSGFSSRGPRAGKPLAPYTTASHFSNAREPLAAMASAHLRSAQEHDLTLGGFLFSPSVRITGRPAFTVTLSSSPTRRSATRSIHPPSRVGLAGGGIGARRSPFRVDQAQLQTAHCQRRCTSSELDKPILAAARARGRLRGNRAGHSRPPGRS